MKLVLLLIVLVACVSARHLHPREDNEDQWRRIANERVKSQALDDEFIEMELLHKIRPSRFVPINHPPCWPGYKRDALGVCREVWD